MHFAIEEPPYRDLVKAAVGAKDKAYCPYSNFHVGAAVLSSSYQIFTGNIFSRNQSFIYLGVKLHPYNGWGFFYLML